jgi:hypothetical protein
MALILAEHLTALEKGLITQIQYNITARRLEAPKQATYSYLQKEYHISRPEALERCFIHTALIEKWEPQTNGGAPTYLSPYDTYRFLEDVRLRANEADCITVHDALELALSLKRERVNKAQNLLNGMNCEQLSLNLRKIESPNRDWLRNTLKKHGIKVCTPQQLEIYRRKFCTVGSISSFYMFYQLLFQRDPRLIFNMDETQLNSSRKFKVLVPKRELPLITCDEKIPHITAAITIGAGGAIFKPLIIFKQMKCKNSVAEFESSCNLASSRNGWMTKSLFRYFAILFVAELSHYRLILPEGIRDEPILLILDGHTSRYDFLALLILFAFNVDVLILPPHSTHVTQPFDVSIASPLKTCFKRQLLALLPQLLELDSSLRQKASTLRKIVLESFTLALSKSSNLSNIKSGFEKTGIVPYSVMKPLSSQYVFEYNQFDINRIQDDNKRIDDARGIGTRMLTSEKALNYLCQLEKNRDIVDDDFAFNLESILEELYSAPVEDGRALSQVESLLIEENNALIRRINFPAPPEIHQKVKCIMEPRIKRSKLCPNDAENKRTYKQKLIYKHKFGELTNNCPRDFEQYDVSHLTRTEFYEYINYFN